MDVEKIGIVAAAVKFEDVAARAIELARHIHSRTDTELVRRNISQLETFAKVSNKIATSWDLLRTDPVMEKTLKQCTATVISITGHLEGVNISAADGVAHGSGNDCMTHWDGPQVLSLFDQLQRDHISLLLHRSFSPEFTQHIIESLKGLPDDRPRQLSTPRIDEQEFLDAVFITDPRDDRSALISKKGHLVEGTCSWITETVAYRAWLSTTAESPVLLIEGGPGKGKSMIAIYLTEQLEQLARLATNETVIYFFCDYRSTKRDNTTAILRCLVWQLCLLRPQLLKHGVNELKARGGRPDNLFANQPSAIETLWRIFVNMVTDPNAGTVSCIIDGLDECDTDSINSVKERFQNFLSGPGLAGSRKVRLAILSRPPQVHHHILLSSAPKIKLDPDSDKEVNRDVTEFVKERVRELSLAREYPEALRQRVEDALQKKAGGTFLWVGLVTQNLRGKSAIDAVEDLEIVPAGLKDIYDRILLGIPHEHRRQVRDLLHWIGLAHHRHPLIRKELRVLVEDQLGDQAGSRDIDYYLGLCSHLLTLKGTADGTKTVHLVHQSAKDYLFRPKVDANPNLEFFRARPEIIHEHLARRCLDILEQHFDSSQDNPTRRFSSRSRVTLDYATMYWPYHMRLCGQSFAQSDSMSKAMKFLKQGSRLNGQWLSRFASDEGDLRSVYGWIHGFPKKTCRSIQTLELACYFGIEAVVRVLTKAMSLPAYLLQRGSLSTVKIAISSGHPQIVAVLVERFGRLAAREEGALFVAAEKSDVGSLELLLKMGADPSKGFMAVNSTPLHVAARQGCVAISTKLLEAGAPPNKRDTQGATPLHIAAACAQGAAIANVEVLLKHGADPNAKCSKDIACTPLQSAAFYVSNPEISLGICARLLAAGADVHAKDVEGQTAFLLAILFKHYKQAQLLLEHGADPNDVSSHNGRTALIIMASHLCRGTFQAGKGCMETVRQIARWGGDVNWQDNEGQTALHVVALHLAAQDYNWALKSPSDIYDKELLSLRSLVQFLVDLEIDEEIRDKAGRTARDIFPYREKVLQARSGS